MSEAIKCWVVWFKGCEGVEPGPCGDWIGKEDEDAGNVFFSESNAQSYLDAFPVGANRADYEIRPAVLTVGESK